MSDVDHPWGHLPTRHRAAGNALVVPHFKPRGARFSAALLTLILLFTLMLGCAERSASTVGGATSAAVSPTANSAMEDLQAGIDANLRNEHAQAVAPLTRAIESGDLEQRFMLQALEARSGAYLSLGQLGKARSDCERALEIDPDFAPAKINRAIIWKSNGQVDRAIADLDSALESGRLSEIGYAIAHFHRGEVALLMQDYERARSEADALLSLAPGESAGFVLRGRVLLALGQTDAALSDLDRALAIDSDLPFALRARAQAFMTAGKFNRADDDYERLIELNGADDQAYLGLGRAHSYNGDQAIAIGDFANAVSIDPKSPDGYRGRAQAEFYMGDFKNAASDFAQAYGSRPRDPLDLIWLYTTQRRDRDRVGPNVKNAIEVMAESDKWPGPLAKLMLTTEDPANLVAAIAALDYPSAKERNCAVEFFLGQRALLAGDLKKARQHFDAAVRQETHDLPECVGAKFELMKLPS